MNFQSNPLIERRDAAEKLYYSSLKVPSIIDGPQPNLTSFVPNVRGVPDTKNRKIPPREADIRRRRYVAVQLICSYLWADPKHT